MVRILSPNSADGYAELGHLSIPFFRTAWRAVVIADLLYKFLLRVRPYEVTSGESDRMYELSLSRMSWAIENSPLNPRCQLDAILRALAICRDGFRSIQLRREKRPLIGVVGEIFCRLNAFSNQDTIRRLEAAGAEAWIVGFREWVWYAGSEETRLIKLHRRRVSLETVRVYLRSRFQRYDETEISRVFQSDFHKRHDPEIGEVLNAAVRYLPPDGAVGEMVLNVGNVVCLARRGVSGIIDISPFTCMNGIVSEALYPAISRDLKALPIRSLYFDGTHVDLDQELGIFVEMARQYCAKKVALRIPIPQQVLVEDAQAGPDASQRV